MRLWSRERSWPQSLLRKAGVFFEINNIFEVLSFYPNLRNGRREHVKVLVPEATWRSPRRTLDFPGRSCRLTAAVGYPDPCTLWGRRRGEAVRGTLPLGFAQHGPRPQYTHETLFIV